MKDRYIITVGRQFGSGGRDIGHKLARSLGIAYYDKELLQEIQKESGLSGEYLSGNDEMHQGIWTHALAGFMYDGMFTQEAIFRYQSEAIKKIADNHPAVIVGRCADYILRDYTTCVNLFLHAPAEFCARRLSMDDEIGFEEAIDLVGKMNKKRASYYNLYTDKRWGNVASYHLSVDTSVLGIDGTAEVLHEFILKKLSE